MTAPTMKPTTDQSADTGAPAAALDAGLARERAPRHLQARADRARARRAACTCSTPRASVPRLRQRHRRERARLRRPGLKAAMHAAADGLMHTSNLYRTAPGEQLGGDAGRALVRRQGVLLQLGRGGERGRVQVRAPLGAHASARRSTRSSRCAARSTAGCSARSRRPIGRLPRCRSARSRRGSRSSSATSRSSTPRSNEDTVAALIVEPMQGEGGVRVLDHGFLRELRALTKERNIALIFDEIQCGLGRTGTLFAYEQVGHRAGHAHAREAARRRAADGRGAHDRGDRGGDQARRSRHDVRRRTVRRVASRCTCSSGSPIRRCSRTCARPARGSASELNEIAHRTEPHPRRCAARASCGAST